jgi:hypothetical protein
MQNVQSQKTTNTIQGKRDVDSRCQRKNEAVENKQSEFELNQDPTRYGDWVKNGRCIDF